MIVPFLTLLCAHQKPAISRDEYGVPHIQASTVSDAFFQAGYAVAQDRLWQMESSRRLARGRLSEVFGKALVNSDREILSTGYTDEELQQQFDQGGARCFQRHPHQFRAAAADPAEPVGQSGLSGTAVFPGEPVEALAGLVHHMDGVFAAAQIHPREEAEVDIRFVLPFHLDSFPGLA